MPATGDCPNAEEAEDTLAKLEAKKKSVARIIKEERLINSGNQHSCADTRVALMYFCMKRKGSRLFCYKSTGILFFTIFAPVLRDLKLKLRE